MEEPFPVSFLNDFIFCPASIYFHMVDADTEKMSYESYEQLQGSAIHESVDNAKYSDKTTVLQGISVYCEKYNLSGKIDLFDTEKGLLTERKRKISSIYDGQVFQLFAYCFALREMGYTVRQLRFHSIIDNKLYPVPLPEDNVCMLKRFEKTIENIQTFDINSFVQSNFQKCAKCVYEPLCSYSAKGKQ
ncbi:MAG: type V CRISPR-associated protein Cas4 [Eubacteriales bacterium]